MAGYIGSKIAVTQVDGYNRTEADAEFVNDPNAVITVSGSNVGIGTTSPATRLHVNTGVNENFNVFGGALGTAGGVTLASTTDGFGAYYKMEQRATAFAWHNGTTERMRIDSSGNVGIGNTSSGYVFTSGETRLAVGDGSEHAAIQIYSGTTKWGGLEFADDATNGTGQGRVAYYHPDNYMRFDTNGSEAMRIDSSGNLLVGKTAISSATEGAELRPTGQAILVADGTNPILMNRLTSDGDIAVFRKDGSTVGSIGNSGNYMYLASQGPSAQGVKITDNFIPATTSGANNDNAMDLGGASVRWDDVYATNGTIQTSDRNEKQDIEALSDAEQRVAVAAKGLLRKYRWKDAVAEKGDAARIHFGIIAQDLQAAFEAEGLDASRYGMFISSTWWEAEVEKTREVEQEDGTTITETYTATETYDEPTEGATERTRLGVRYPELLAFIIAAL